MRDLFGATVTAPPAATALDPAAEPEPPLPRTVLPPGAWLVTFGTRQQAGSTCPLTGAPATFGACLDCLYYRGPAGLGVACATLFRIGRAFAQGLFIEPKASAGD